MGRHNWIHPAPQQELTPATARRRSAAGHVGRVGLLAVTLGVGAVIAGGVATASADTTSSKIDGAKQSATDARPAVKRKSESSTSDTESSSEDDSKPSAGDDPGTVPATALTELRRAVTTERRADSGASDFEAEEASPPVKPRSARNNLAPDVPSVPSTVGASASSVASVVDAPVPSPGDEVETPHGDIGKWMLQSNGKIADYGGLPYDGKTVLEPVNVIIVDPTSRNARQATWRLNAAMRRAGFPPRFIHSTGFEGLIDDQRYRQQPSGFLVGYSDDFFLVRNNHGRIFGPDPVETAGGYVWSGSFSTEDLAFVNGLPRHVYVSSNEARDALAADLVASGRGQLGGVVALDNSYNTETVTTGDHDGSAIVIILTDPYAAARAMRVRSAASSAGRTCVAAGDP
jgi:hypothetical protein